VREVALKHPLKLALQDVQLHVCVFVYSYILYVHVAIASMTHIASMPYTHVAIASMWYTHTLRACHIHTHCEHVVYTCRYCEHVVYTHIASMPYTHVAILVYTCRYRQQVIARARDSGHELSVS